MKEDDLSAVKWIHGAPDCTRGGDPPLAVHRFDRDTFILRVSKCFSFEGNFLYLLCGRQRAILFDTGGPADPGSPFAVLPLRATVDAILAGWLAERGQAEIELVVAHTHGHGDHVFGDGQFADRPCTLVVPPALSAVQEFFGLPEWPEGEAEVDLGGRLLTIFPIPGHEPSHLAVYDPATRILLTGDTLYPGLLTVRSWPDYRRSAARLAAFVKENEVSLVLGNHIEMKKTPGELYPLPTSFQPEEHALPLLARHVLELHHACEAMADAPRREVRDEFVIEPL